MQISTCAHVHVLFCVRLTVHVFCYCSIVADRVVVTSKHNDEEQYIWESDTSSFSIARDPRGNSLLRGTTVSLFMKEEAQDFLTEGTLKELIKKYSQFINFPIYVWESKVRPHPFCETAPILLLIILLVKRDQYMCSSNIVTYFLQILFNVHVLGIHVHLTCYMSHVVVYYFYCYILYKD